MHRCIQFLSGRSTRLPVSGALFVSLSLLLMGATSRPMEAQIVEVEVTSESAPQVTELADPSIQNPDRERLRSTFSDDDDPIVAVSGVWSPAGGPYVFTER